ncbi:WhiB family transcriptional regulator [Microbacterium istanbulense]|uniref:WhiB family transcriptional regulator n=1 Tax=Microbacterium istanbulense TaxID=3122049 RepID=A0ABU8LNM3_9MICO
MAEVFARHSQTNEATEAFDDLSHGLLLAREKRQEVPCLGPGAEAWTSDDATDQELAADLCLLCPVFALCQRYADAEEPSAGTWAGVTRNKTRAISEEWAARKARGTTGRGRDRASRRLSRKGRRWTPGQRDCTCGCGGVTKGGWYLSGHDSMHLARLRADLRSKTITADAALAEVAHSEALQAKLRAQLGIRG